MPGDFYPNWYLSGKLSIIFTEREQKAHVVSFIYGGPSLQTGMNLCSGTFRFLCDYVKSHVMSHVSHNLMFSAYFCGNFLQCWQVTIFRRSCEMSLHHSALPSFQDLLHDSAEFVDCYRAKQWDALPMRWHRCTCVRCFFLVVLFLTAWEAGSASLALYRLSGTRDVRQNDGVVTKLPLRHSVHGYELFDLLACPECAKSRQLHASSTLVSMIEPRHWWNTCIIHCRCVVC